MNKSSGIAVSSGLVIRKRRLLPVRGTVLVEKGQIVTAETIVARADMPGDVIPLAVADRLGTSRSALRKNILVEEGDAVQKGQIIARSESLWGLFRSTCQSPVTGIVESIGETSGQVIVRKESTPVEVKAFIPGRVVSVAKGEGVEIECEAAFAQGIFGIGGERIGRLKILSSDADQADFDLSEPASLANTIILGGASVDAKTLKDARKRGAIGWITGGIDDCELRRFLGRDIGIAITGSENIGFTLIITEGFGQVAMAASLYSMIASYDGQSVSINGATQIRAGVIRPEIIIPLTDSVERADEKENGDQSLSIGTTVRCIRAPWFGMTGTIVELPEQPQRLPSEVQARVAIVSLADRSRITVPRANLEIIASTM